MNENIVSFDGKLILDDSGSVVLGIEKKNYYPLPYPPYVAIPVEIMKMEAVSVYQDYINKTVTMAGFPQGDLIYDARVIRTFAPRDETEAYGEDYWNNRVPKADILFTARKLPGYEVHFPVDVRQMITINDSTIRKDLEQHALMLQGPEKCNDYMYRIYRHSRVKEINPYFYQYDNYIFGCEFFMYPYELRVLKKGDCDDWGIELASYLITAGVPEWRVRCVVGLTRSGGGHLTVCVLADDLATWYHLNSTIPWWVVEEHGWGTLTDFPKADDSTDDMGIGDVWFSFNNKFAWHTFETHASLDNARRTPWMKNFRITPRFD
ncbi:MAG: hypothetical protein ACFFCW_01355 [Candidatus Hodarchaeota archaeon]